MATIAKYLLFIPIVMVLHQIWLSGSNQTAGVDNEPAIWPAIGISLMVSYGTVSMRHPDGGFEDIGLVNGSDNYVKMMKHLSMSSAEHPSPPYHSMEDMWDDIPRQAWRSVRKKLGLPASSDVKILSIMIQELLALAPSPHLPIVLIGFPGLIALYNEDLLDAAEYLGLPKLHGHYSYHPREIIAAYAGHGMGLPDNLPVRNVILVEYTEQALLLHTTVLSEARDLGDTDILAASSFNLGSGSPLDGYLEHITEFVEGVVRTCVPSNVEEILVIITGSAMDGAVQDAIQKAIKLRVPTVHLITSQPRHIAARGAAELAWRSNTLEGSG